jgi:hypothetical protein
VFLSWQGTHKNNKQQAGRLCRGRQDDPLLEQGVPDEQAPDPSPSDGVHEIRRRLAVWSAELIDSGETIAVDCRREERCCRGAARSRTADVLAPSG